MLRKTLLGLTAGLMLLSVIPDKASAGPLTDFSRGKTAIDFNYKPNLDLEASSDKHSNYEWGITTALDNKYALQYRDTKFNTDPTGITYRAHHQELNLYYKVTKNIQIFTGYHKTGISNTTGGFDVPDNSGLQFGILGTKELSKRSYLYGTLSAGSGNTYNVEFGLAWKLNKAWELNTTYRHLTIEKIGSQNHTADLRGFGIGFTYKY